MLVRLISWGELVPDCNCQILEFLVFLLCYEVFSDVNTLFILTGVLWLIFCVPSLPLSEQSLVDLVFLELLSYLLFRFWRSLYLLSLAILRLYLKLKREIFDIRDVNVIKIE